MLHSRVENPPNNASTPFLLSVCLTHPILPAVSNVPLRCTTHRSHAFTAPCSSYHAPRMLYELSVMIHVRRIHFLTHLTSYHAFLRIGELPWGFHGNASDVWYEVSHPHPRSTFSTGRHNDSHDGRCPYLTRAVRMCLTEIFQRQLVM